MSVHERRYQPYDGPWTPAWSRFTVIPRFAFREVFANRLFLSLFVASFFPTLVALVYIYLRHNANALAILDVPLDQLSAIDANYFYIYMRVQGWFALILCFVVGPGLVSVDFRNNALPLYLGRPFSRGEYVLGKISVLVALLSAITWIPGLLLFALQAWLEGAAWWGANAWLGWALFASSWVAILAIALPTLAISALVKWRPLAAAGLIMAAVVPIGIGETVNGIFDTWRGSLISLVHLLKSVWAGLFRLHGSVELPLGSAWTALAVILALCLLTLWRRVRAYEVSR
jgi:ABC-2 type transport system permease protein